MAAAVLSSSSETFSAHSSSNASLPKRNFGRQNIITSEVTAALDRSKVSNRSAVRVLLAAASNFGRDSSELSISRFGDPPIKNALPSSDGQRDSTVLLTRRCTDSPLEW